MITNRYINTVIVVLVLLAVTFSCLLVFAPESIHVFSESESPAYVSQLFDKDSVMTVNIIVDEEDWQLMLDNAQQEEYIPCDVEINKKTYDSVGIRPKGNSSLNKVSGTSQRYSFKIEFDHYIDGQTCLGLDKLVLNNTMSDASYMKEYICYDLMNYMGVPASLYTYANITVNGEDWGLYFALESVEDSFAQRNFGDDYGLLYSVKSMGGGNGSSGGGDLLYTDDDPSNYGSIFNNEVFDGTEKDYQRVIEAIKNLNEGTNLESCLDVDEILRYLAVHTTVVNFDSYISNMKQNYYIYEENGKLSILPWDYNSAFGGFQRNNTSSAVNFPIDTPVSGVELEQRPLVAKLLEVPEYMEKYHEYLSQIVDGYFNSGKFTGTVQKVDAMINEDVKNDETAFYTYDQYLTAVKTLKEFGLLRAKSIEGQLSGSIPSTTAGQSASPDSLIDASSLDISALGSEGGGGGRGAAPGAIQGGRTTAQNESQRQDENFGTDWPEAGGGAAFSRPAFDENTRDGQIKDNVGMQPFGGSMDFSGADNQNDGRQTIMDRTLMEKAREIIGDSDIDELTQEQISKLKDLGLTEEQIETMKNMLSGQGRQSFDRQGGIGGANDGPAPDRAGNQPAGGNVPSQSPQDTGLSEKNLAMLGISIVSLLIGIIFVALFERRGF